jgi:hypothetical protein
MGKTSEKRCNFFPLNRFFPKKNPQKSPIIRFNKKTSEGLQESIFSTSKIDKNQKFIWDLFDGVCRLNPKS